MTSSYIGDLSDAQSVYDSEAGIYKVYTLDGHALVLHVDPSVHIPDFSSFGVPRVGWSTIASSSDREIFLMDERVIRFFYTNYVANGKREKIPNKIDEYGYGIVFSWFDATRPMLDFFYSIGINRPVLDSLRWLMISKIPKGERFTLVKSPKGGEAIVLEKDVSWFSL